MKQLIISFIRNPYVILLSAIIIPLLSFLNDMGIINLKDTNQYFITSLPYIKLIIWLFWGLVIFYLVTEQRKLELKVNDVVKDLKGKDIVNESTALQITVARMSIKHRVNYLAKSIRAGKLLTPPKNWLTDNEWELITRIHNTHKEKMDELYKENEGAIDSEQTE